MNQTSNIEIFQGNPIEDQGELRFLELLIADLEAINSEAIIFMNFHLTYHQKTRHKKN